MKDYTGLFITFEGPEGSGKTTQLKKALEFLESQGRKVVMLREPGGTPVSEAIRSVLLDPKLTEMEPQTELLLFLAARSEIVRKKIIPALEQGYDVLCDRYEDSTLAYQGYGREDLSLEAIEKMCPFVRGNIVPDITFLLDIDPKAGMKRGGRHDRMEKQSLDFHERVRNGFLDLASKQKDRFMILDATQDKATIAKKIRERLTDGLA